MRSKVFKWSILRLIYQRPCAVHLDRFLSVPPDILSSGTSEGEVSVLEGENATLSCKASGRPSPRVLWRREKSGFILMRGLHDPLIPGKILHFYLASSTLATVVAGDK